MSLWKIAWRSMQARLLASTLTGISMALGVALVVTVLVLHGVIERKFNQGAQGYHMIVGAKGGKLQLVLNTVYHLSQPIENIPWDFYQEFRHGQFAAVTKLAVPYCLGDSFLSGNRSFRVVGTTPDMFDKIEYDRNSDGTPKKYQFQAGGRNFKSDAFFEAVIGSVVASHSGLKVGDHFQPSHGIIEAGGEGQKHEGFEIVGILEPTGTPNDHALFVNIEGFYLLDGHAKPLPKPAVNAASNGETSDAAVATASAAKNDAGDAADTKSLAEQSAATNKKQPKPLPEAQREVTAILVLLSSDLMTQSVFSAVNKGNVAQAVLPAREVADLFQNLVGPVQLILLVLTFLIVIVAGIGILVSIYNSMSERRHEIAVMRALGAGRTTVMLVILLESILLSLAGGLAGVLLGHGLMGLLSPTVVERTGVAIHMLQFDLQELILIPALVVLASLVGFLPAWSAYRTDVAKALSANP